MIIIAKVQFPPEAAQETAACFLKAPERPDYMVMKGPYFASNISGGITAITLYELDNSKIGDGMEFLSNHYASYFGIPGFRHEIRPFLEVEEALKSIGIG